MLILFSKIGLCQNDSFEITITNIRNSTGTIKWAVFKNESQFKTNTQYVDAGSVQATTGCVKIITKNIADGNYAISVYHDENNNSEIDFNFFGLPIEGFGFSNDPVIYFGPPSFKECVIEKNGKTSKSIKIKYYL
jgi:uncharacterized protein (DUF2141 family)